MTGDWPWKCRGDVFVPDELGMGGSNDMMA